LLDAILENLEPIAGKTGDSIIAGTRHRNCEKHRIEVGYGRRLNRNGRGRAFGLHRASTAGLPSGTRTAEAASLSRRKVSKRECQSDTDSKNREMPLHQADDYVSVAIAKPAQRRFRPDHRHPYTVCDSL
jgi:hypothetical protein